MAPFDSGIGGVRRIKSGDVDRRVLAKVGNGKANVDGGVVAVRSKDTSLQPGIEQEMAHKAEVAESGRCHQASTMTISTHACPVTSKPPIFAPSGKGPRKL